MPVILVPPQLYQTRPQSFSLFFGPPNGCMNAFALETDWCPLCFLCLVADQLQYTAEACPVDRRLSCRDRDRWRRRIYSSLVTWIFHRSLQAHDFASLAVNSAASHHEIQIVLSLILEFMSVQQVSLQAVDRIRSRTLETSQALRTSIRTPIAISCFLLTRLYFPRFCCLIEVLPLSDYFFDY